MKTKILLLLSLSIWLMPYLLTAFNKPATSNSYLDKIIAVFFSNTKIESIVIKNPNGTICKGSTNGLMMAPVLWSSASSWTALNLQKPVDGSAVIIPAGIHMILDETPPNLASLTINGKLEFANTALNLTTGWIMVSGTLQIGTATTPFTSKAIITLNATNMTHEEMGMGTRGIMVMGGKLELHGTPPAKHFTKLNEHAAAGSNNLSLLNSVNWSVTDEIVVATSDFYNAGNGSAQRTKIINTTGSVLSIQDGLNAQRWGKLQYLTATGMSLTPGTLPANILPGTPTVLDERAEVANLTRNIVIQSVDDALWRNNGFGCHIMIMRSGGITGEARLNGVEIKRGGQAGKKGRYPFHWHMLSYSGSTTLPDVTGQYISNSTINESAQRGIVIHGTNGAIVRNNVVYDVRGHGVFTEDASERRNIIDGNIVMKIRNPLPNNVLKQHESFNINPGGSSGLWISNPDNTVRNNIVTDSEAFGYWLAFPIRAFGESAAVPLKPLYMKFGVFNNNIAHSNKLEGIFMDAGESDEAGNVERIQYFSTSNMTNPTRGNGVENVEIFELLGNTVWKNSNSGIWMAAGAARNRGSISADNVGRFFAGKTDTVYPTVVEKALAVGTSLNYNMNGVTRPTGWNIGPISAFASYHSSADIQNNVIVNFPAEQGKATGFMALNDYYITPVDKGNIRNTGNILINSHPGVRTKPTDNNPAFTQHVYGALLDSHNVTGVANPSPENYYVYDETFFTHGQTRQIVAPSPEISGGVIVRGPFYGIAEYYVNRIERPFDKIVVNRSTATGSNVGNWVVESSVDNNGVLSQGMLGNMRHFATHPSGFYHLDWPTINDVNDVIFRVDNLLTDNEYQVLSVEFSGNYNVENLFAMRSHDMNDYTNGTPFPGSDGFWRRTYTPVANYDAVVNAPTGQVYWHDKINNKVWMKLRGGFIQKNTSLPDNHDFNLYRSFKIRVYGKPAPLSLASQATTLSSRIYPNPASDVVTVEYNLQNNDNINILVHDIVGRQYSSTKTTGTAGQNVQNLNFGTYPNGVYFVTVKNGTDLQSTMKIIKN